MERSGRRWVFSVFSGAMWQNKTKPKEILWGVHLCDLYLTVPCSALRSICVWQIGSFVKSLLRNLIWCFSSDPMVRRNKCFWLINFTFYYWIVLLNSDFEIILKHFPSWILVYVFYMLFINVFYSSKYYNCL